MALPAHLQHYDSLLDLLVEELVRAIEADSQSRNAREPAPPDAIAWRSAPTNLEVPHVI